MSEVARGKSNQGSGTGGKGAKNAAANELTDEKLAAYILDALISFRQMTDRREMTFLTYLLDMATQEAAELCDRPMPSK